MENCFFESVLQYIKIGVEQIVVVTHLAPGVEDFLLAVNKKIKIAALIPKPNSINPVVQGKLEKSIPILCYTRRQIKHHSSEFLQALGEKVGNRSFAIIDTGGYFSHVLHVMTAERGFSLHGVAEVTENGHQKYEHFLARQGEGALFPYPVISVARSSLKDPEDFLVGQAVVFSAEALLREEIKIFAGKRAVVLGYGKIGSSIAAHLRAKSVQVDVYDSNPVRQALAFAHGFLTRSRESLLPAADMIFCATGNRSLDIDDFNQIKPGAFIFTATSGDDEILDYEKIISLAAPGKNPRIAELRMRKGCIFLCNAGNSANFMHGGVVGPFIKLVQAELIFALSQFEHVRRDRICHLSESSKRFIADIWVRSFFPESQSRT